jgi:Domain of Unknown Function (DUF748)
VSGFVRRRWRWVAAIAAVPVVLAIGMVVADFMLDEPFRRDLERRMNARLKGYKVSVGKADVHLLGIAFDLKDIVVIQEAHPDPPVAKLKALSASLQWKALIHRRLVANFTFDRPTVYFNLAHFRAEQKDPTPVSEHGWQDALEAIYPFKINEVKIVEGDVTYEDRGPFPPLHLSRINMRADNIRNIHSRHRSYPSDIRLEARVFEEGGIVLDGNADFLGEPSIGLKAGVDFKQIKLDYLKPITERYHVAIRKGTLAGQGTVEHTQSGETTALIREVRADGLDVDWIHKAETQASETQVKQTAVKKTEEASNKPGMLVKLDVLRIAHSTFGVTNASADPIYRVFISDAEVEVKNLSNQSSEGTSEVNLRGKFMGSGPAVAHATVRAGDKGPNLDLALRITDTDLVAMNDIFRAYGKFDIAAGKFSFFSELSVKDSRIDGYVKPLFRDLKVTDARNDEEKSVFRKLYVKLVGGVAKLLENRSRKEVATVTPVGGRLDEPKTSTWQVVVNLVRNAFIKAILPGFEEEVSRLKRA